MYDNIAAAEAVSAAIGHMNDAHAALIRLGGPDERPQPIEHAIALLGVALDLLGDYEDQ